MGWFFFTNGNRFLKIENIDFSIVSEGHISVDYTAVFLLRFDNFKVKIINFHFFRKIECTFDALHEWTASVWVSTYDFFAVPQIIFWDNFEIVK